MKVLMLGWELPPYNSGGLGVACYQLCRALSKRNIDIEFVLPYKAEHNIDFMRVTAAWPQTVASFQLSGTAYDSQYYTLSSDDIIPESLDLHAQQQLYEQAVARLAETREFDVIHAHDWLTFRAALKLRELKRCPIILHIHSVESDRAANGFGNPLAREVEAIALQLADRVIAVSQQTKDAIVHDYDVPADKIEVVHNSISVSDIEPLDADNAYEYLTAMKDHGYRVVVNVGRLTIQKGLPNLLRAMKVVIEKAPKTLLLMVGSGEQYYELIELAAELGIGANVLFADFQRGKNWRDAFAVGNLFVMPSVSEPFGLTPLEAIGYGTPALISKQSGVSEVLKNCLKVDYWDIDEMANQIVAVMKNDALGSELQTNAYREYEKMSWDGASDKIARVYEAHMAEASL